MRRSILQFNNIIVNFITTAIFYTVVLEHYMTLCCLSRVCVCVCSDNLFIFSILLNQVITNNNLINNNIKINNIVIVFAQQYVNMCDKNCIILIRLYKKHHEYSVGLLDLIVDLRLKPRHYTVMTIG